MSPRVVARRRYDRRAVLRREGVDQTVDQLTEWTKRDIASPRHLEVQTAAPREAQPLNQPVSATQVAPPALVVSATPLEPGAQPK